jgi:hypothetical protein
MNRRPHGKVNRGESNVAGSPAFASGIIVPTGPVASRILEAWWKSEAICAACRVKKSASVLTTGIVFGVAPGDPIFRYGNCFSGALIRDG